MKIFIIFLFFPLRIIAQDYTGVWVGTLYNDTTQQYLPYEIAISENKGKLTGFSHITFLVNGKEEVGVKTVKIIKGRDKIFMEDESLVYNNYTEQEPKGVKKKSELSLSRLNSETVLSGPFKINGTRSYLSLTGSIHLSKKDPVTANKILAKLSELKLSGSLSFLPIKIEEETAKFHEEKLSLSASETKAENIYRTVQVNEEPLLAQNSLPDKGPVSGAGNIEKNSAPDGKMDIAGKPSIPEIKEEALYKAVLIKETPPLAKHASQHQKTGSVPPKLKAPNPPVITLKEVAVTSDVPDKKNISAEQYKLKKTMDVGESTQASKVLSQATLPKQIANLPQQTQKKPGESVIAKDTSFNKSSLATSPVVSQKEKEIVSSVSNQRISSVISTPVISAEDLAKRKIETIKSVYFKTDSLKLTLYDNGEVDGDTVSILLNGRVIMPKQGLNTTAITKTIYITPELGDSLQLIMYAENLGSIPPNTGLLIIQDGEDRYEIRFAGDLQKNSAIILKRNKSISQ